MDSEQNSWMRMLQSMTDAELFDEAVRYVVNKYYSEEKEQSLLNEVVDRLKNASATFDASDLYRFSNSPLRVLGNKLGAEVPRPPRLSPSEVHALQDTLAPWEAAEAVVQKSNRAVPELEPDDRSLAEAWCRDGRGESKFYLDAMLSARGAELMALTIYRELYGSAIDLSILQLSRSDDVRWHTADILANSQYIDVKNARSDGERRSYSEFLVPRFKKDRRGRDVAICGILSPLITTCFPAIWLGETSLQAIQVLCNEFESDYLDMSYLGDIEAFIPSWMFDYPSVCYHERDRKIHVLRTLRTCDGAEVPAVSTPLAIHPADLCAVSREGMYLANRFCDDRPCRPVLFLHVLDRFCSTAISGDEFPFERLNQGIFLTKSRLGSETFQNPETPLAIADPLRSIHNLLNVLGSVAATCRSRAVRFRSFRLRGPAILQGKRQDGNWSTIFAYCGGWKVLDDGRRVRCGQMPIYMGQDDECSRCHRLVCHKCGFCHADCNLMKVRQESWPPGQLGP